MAEPVSGRAIGSYQFAATRLNATTARVKLTREGRGAKGYKKPTTFRCFKYSQKYKI